QHRGCLLGFVFADLARGVGGQLLETELAGGEEDHVDAVSPFYVQPQRAAAAEGLVVRVGGDDEDVHRVPPTRSYNARCSAIMRASENRSSARLRTLARSSSSAARRSAARSSAPVAQYPVMPSSTTSGAAPKALVTTGVPHIMASTRTSEKGSGSWTGA